MNYYEEINQHLMEDRAPSVYFNLISVEAVFSEYPLNMLLKLKSTEQSAKHHPEGSVWNHTMLVVDEAALVREESRDAKALMWAALLHDVGKPGTTRNRKGKITSYDHDTVGAKLVKKFLEVFTNDEEFISKVEGLVKYHMHMLYVLKNLPYGDPQMMIKEVDPHEIALLCRCDRLGREGVDRQAEEENYRLFATRIMTN
ncbi:MAG TPA: HDIG domain-containing protein [Mobilitalea sp.]|nr:HDIG domain-containing protein [Mobilitalea sp.]